MPMASIAFQQRREATIPIQPNQIISWRRTGILTHWTGFRPRKQAASPNTLRKVTMLTRSPDIIEFI
jgi:hypothetical protein